MKTISELNPHHFPTNPSIDKNLQILFERLIEVQEMYGLDIQVTSGLRSDEMQADLISKGVTKAVHSKHIAGAAADIYDPDKKLAEWVKNNMNAMAKIGFWFEDFGHTPNWVHFQIMAPGSGNRVFIP